MRPKPLCRHSIGKCRFASQLEEGPCLFQHEWETNDGQHHPILRRSSNSLYWSTAGSRLSGNSTNADLGGNSRSLTLCGIHEAMNTRPGKTLELRTELIPRGSLILALERTLGQRLTHEHRYYLADRPVHCGDLLELHLNGQWLCGRYEWSGNPDDSPTFHLSDSISGLDEQSLMRWPPG